MTGTEYIYFVQAGDRGPVKIGLTNDPQGRCDELQIGSPIELVLLAFRPGTFALERDLHARFTEGRLRGEWFDIDTPGLREEIVMATQIEAELALGLGDGRLCRHCGVRPILPPRTRVCSAECELERKRATSRAWRVARRGELVPPEGRA